MSFHKLNKKFFDEPEEIEDNFEDYSKIDVYKKNIKKYKKQFKELEDLDLSDLPEDFIEVKSNYYYLLEVGRTLLEKLINEVLINPTPRNIEIYTNLMKEYSEINNKLIDLHEKIKKILSNSTTNNVFVSNNQQFNVFQGTLQEIIENINNKKENIIKNNLDNIDIGD